MTEKIEKVRPEKKSVVAEIKERLDNAKCAMLVDFKGMSVENSAEIRSRLRECDAEIFITKNRLLKLALDGNGYAGDWERSLHHCSALVTGKGDPVATAKILNSYHKENAILAVKCGMLNGEGLGADDVKQLAELPGKKELQGMLVATLVAPMRQLAGVLEQKKASIVYVLKAIQDKKEAA